MILTKNYEYGLAEELTSDGDSEDGELVQDHRNIKSYASLILTYGTSSEKGVVCSYSS